ncbi:Uncharacterised protein [Bordetella pertussis]|nr:Uncharacterised protein [Bordetella pertussis]
MPMSCSTMSTVTPHSARASRMKRAISSVSSRFMPATGSSSIRMRGCIASARASSTRFCRPYDSAATGAWRIWSISRKSMMRVSISARSATSSRRARPRYSSASSTLLRRCACRPSLMLSSTVMPRNSAMFWKLRARPRRARRGAGRRVMSWPRKWMLPASGV